MKISKFLLVLMLTILVALTVGSQIPQEIMQDTPLDQFIQNKLTKVNDNNGA